MGARDPNASPAPAGARRVRLRRLGHRGVRRLAQLGAHPLQPEPHAALGGADRDAGARGDLARGQPAPVREHDRLALALGQRLQRRAHDAALLVALGRRRRLVVGARLVAARGDLEPVGRAPAGLGGAPEVERAAARHEPQVGAEVAAAGVEGARPAPESEEHVLGHVLRRGRVAENAQGGAVDGGRVLVVDAREGRRVREVHGAHHPLPCDNITQAVECWRATAPTGGTRENRGMANRDRLPGLDAAFLDLESGGAHMHVAGILVFSGEPPAYDELLGAIERRLDLVPPYRQKLAFVPYGQGRPEWVDDPHFNVRYHVRHSALPAPGGDAELERIAGRLFALPLDRGKPLWELALVEGLAPGADGEPRFALISKTHHALVAGGAGGHNNS